MNQSQFVSKCSIDALTTAAQNLKAGHLVAFPTETVYGLGADATNAQAVAKIYQAKGRPADHPLIVHIHDMYAMDNWSTEIPTFAINLARAFWPGPMTLILPRSPLAHNFITGGQETVGIRVPDHAVALALLAAFHAIGGQGIAAPSANRFGQISPTTAQAVCDELAQYLSPQDQILDGGPCTVGVESTIIDCTGPHPTILRPGAITTDMIQQATGLQPPQSPDSSPTTIRVSGSLESHYSPKAKVVLDEIPQPGDGYLALSIHQTPHGVNRLASPENEDGFAQILYSALREADKQQLKKIVVLQPQGEGIAIAIRDRLQRAANLI